MLNGIFIILLCISTIIMIISLYYALKIFSVWLCGKDEIFLFNKLFVFYDHPDYLKSKYDSDMLEEYLLIGLTPFFNIYIIIKFICKKIREKNKLK